MEPDNPEISKTRQCRLLGISRSSLYYKPKGFSEKDLRIMKAIDEQYLKTPEVSRFLVLDRGLTASRFYTKKTNNINKLDLGFRLV